MNPPRRNISFPLALLAAVALSASLSASLTLELHSDTGQRPAATRPAKPGTVKQAVQAAGDATQANLTFAPDPETAPKLGSVGDVKIVPAAYAGLPDISLRGLRSVTVFANGQLPGSALSPIFHGQLARGPPAAGWNTMNLYRSATLHMARIETNGPASSYRTLAQQIGMKAYWTKLGKPGNAANPGYSVHGIGEGVDNQSYSWTRAHGGAFGWSCSNAPWEGWHTSYCGGFRRPDPGVDPHNPVLAPGSGGPGQAPFVRWLEHRLGFYRADGEFRSNTGAAVRRMERRCGFRYPDQVVTPSTWARLRKPGPVCAPRRRPARRRLAARSAAALPGVVCPVKACPQASATPDRPPSAVRSAPRSRPSPYAREIARFYRVYAITPVPATWKLQVRDVKGLLGYSASRIAWATGTDAAFAKRMAHPTFRMTRSQVRLGIARRAARHSVTGISLAGVRFIADFEGFYPSVYEDPAGFCTAYFGHLIRYSACTAGDRARYPRKSQTQALSYLRADLRSYEQTVMHVLHVRVSQCKFDMLVSFHFNTGALPQSTLLSYVNSNNTAGAAAEFLLWTHAGGQVLPGLVRRRRDERARFLAC